MGLVGVMIGALFGGSIITIGRRDTIFIMSLVMFIGVGLTLIQTFPTMIIGRLMTGFAAAIY